LQREGIKVIDADEDLSIAAMRNAWNQRCRAAASTEMLAAHTIAPDAKISPLL
jgi:hypothetical protein